MSKIIIFRLVAYIVMAGFFLKVVIYNMIREILNYLQLRRFGICSYGKIIEIKDTEDHDGLLLYYPVIEYVFENKTYYLSPIEERSSAKPEIGKRVSILHDRSDPKKAILNTKSTIIHLCLKVFFILVILAVLGAGLFKMLQ